MLRKNLSLILIALIAASCSHKAISKLTGSNSKAEAKTTAKEETQQHEQIVFFDLNSFALTPDAKKILNEKVLPVIKENKSSKIKVEGHCDERGSDAYNKKLGKKRSEAVKKYLVSNGVKSSDIRAISYGKSKPLDPGHNEEAWAKNRRAVTIELK